jgi:hypothetical protein
MLQEITMIVTVLPKIGERECPTSFQFPHKSIHNERQKESHTGESFREELI